MIVGMLLVLFVLGGCHHPLTHSQDPSVAKTEEDFWALGTAVGTALGTAAEKASLPTTPDITKSPLPKSRCPQELSRPLSMHITPDMYIQDVLAILCEKAGISYVIADDVEGYLAYDATNRPLGEILQTLCQTLHLTYRWDNSLLTIQKDVPCLKTYPMTFITQTRQSESHVANNTHIVSGATQENGQNNGSTHALDTKSTQDFWRELEETLKILLPSPFYFSIQKHAGLVHVYATHQIHDHLAIIFKRLQTHMRAQVLIEAKIVEVTLKDAYKGGIDWAALSEKHLSLEGQFGAVLRTSPALMGHANTGGGVMLNINDHHVKTALSFMESFGTVRTLSSPRITVLHNQSALLRVAENQVFFHVKYERQFLNNDNDNYGSVVAAQSQIQTIPIGLVLSVHPAIDPETKAIILNLRPTISRIVGTREDPSVRLMANTMKNNGHDMGSEIPIVAIREMDSVLKLMSGQTAILGGLMIEGSDHISTGFPGSRRGPFSFLTSAKRSNHMMTELVIFLKATLVDSPFVTDADQRLYQDFTKDPRPFDPQKQKVVQ